MIAVDIEGYSARIASEQLRVQEELRFVLDRAARQASLDRTGWHRQVRGDGELAVLPDLVDVPHVVGEFIAGLGSELAELNRRPASATPLRLRVALHHGTLTPGPFGPAGDAPIMVSRLLDAPPLRKHLAKRQRHDFVLVVSDSLYRDVVRTGFCPLDPAGFRAVRVVIKGITYTGHIYQGTVARTRADDVAFGHPASARRPA